MRFSKIRNDVRDDDSFVSPLIRKHSADESLDSRMTEKAVEALAGRSLPRRPDRVERGSSLNLD